MYITETFIMFYVIQSKFKWLFKNAIIVIMLLLVMAYQGAKENSIGNEKSQKVTIWRNLEYGLLAL